MNYTQHPLSAAFPSMSAEDFQSLKDDIEVNGQREPVMIFENMVLDGWHRYRACIELGIKPTQFNFPVNDDPVVFVESVNLHRRHLTASQRAIAIVATRAWHPAHRPNKVEATSTLSKNSDLSKAAQVTPRTITDAKAVLNVGLGDVVRDGGMTITQAAQIARGTLEKKPTKPAAKTVTVAPQLPEEGAPDDAEMESVRIQEEAAQKTMQLLLATDAPMADLAAKNTQLEAQIGQLNLRMTGLMNQNRELIQTIKRLQFQIKKQAAA